ncbi:hypothetical protein [Bacillus toyonensis]|uniref:hypothetical protein n=1 Tax=Bacillus toyonensis TaxID=155322 RepID=UPI002E20CB6C|nr:macro domain-containing protein [Bacillus toyonensis]
MLFITRGDLLNSNCNFVLHQANCQKRMGAGLALKIAKRYPQAEKADNEYPLEGRARLGKYSVAKVEEEKWVVNLYAQNYPGKAKSKQEQSTRYLSLKNSITLFVQALAKKEQKEKKQYSIGLPYKIGSDLAGGDWGTVEEILIDISESLKVDFYIFKL